MENLLDITPVVIGIDRSKSAVRDAIERPKPRSYAKRTARRCSFAAGGRTGMAAMADADGYCSESGRCGRSSLEMNTAACVRRSMPSLASNRDT